MLSDTDTYTLLKKNPTSSYKKKLITVITRLLKEKKITVKQKHYLYPTSDITPRIYCTQKIHKMNNPLRPIVDYTGSIMYNLSRSLADILVPLVGNSIHHVTNSLEFVNDIKDIKLQPNETLVSYDVVSLFTKTPVNKSLKIIEERLHCDKQLSERTWLHINDIMELLQLVLTTTYFSFRGDIYQQNSGMAMGSPCSPIVANLFMEWLENEAITTAHTNIKPRIWKRYVDDIITIIPKDATQP
ncbi:uncharacterized protein [Antedon mediterranea]|uniref:uncharacterized protein n=1 Tax=Antedon mediterranea TaxID=105859 RepID=UPI003AF9E146